MKLPVVDRNQPESNKFVTGVENEATGDSKLNDSPVKNVYCAVPENIHTLPTEGLGISWRRGGFCKAR